MPWWGEWSRRNPDSPITNCATCMETLTLNKRIAFGCGFEQPSPRAQPWQPPDSSLGATAKATVCPSYTASLPEVTEVRRSHKHWDKGQLAMFCGGDPTDATLVAVEILDNEIKRCDIWALTPEKDGGGRVDR